MKPRVLTKCVANGYAVPNERIVEVSGDRGRGCLIGIRDKGPDNLQIEVYRREGVNVLLGVGDALKLDERERDTVLAALRFWQHFLDGSAPDAIGLCATKADAIAFAAAREIARNGRGKDNEAALSREEIDALVERINREG